MRILYLLLISVLTSCCNQTDKNTNGSIQKSPPGLQKNSIGENQVKSINPVGTYTLENETKEKGGDIYGYFGEIQVKKAGQGQIAVTFFINKGAPSYNHGVFIDTLKYSNNRAVYTDPGGIYGCKIILEFLRQGIKVTEKSTRGCGFGHGVYANGFFKRISDDVPELINPDTGKRLKYEKDFYSKQIKNGAKKITTIPDIYNDLFDVKLTGLELDKNCKTKRYYVSFSAACMCELSSIIIAPTKKEVYFYPYCNNVPKEGEYRNYFYKIKGFYFINNKLVINATNKGAEKSTLTLIVGKLENKNIFSFDVEGNLPQGLYFTAYLTSKEELFDVCGCGDYQG